MRDGAKFAYFTLFRTIPHIRMCYLDEIQLFLIECQMFMSGGLKITCANDNKSVILYPENNVYKTD